MAIIKYTRVMSFNGNGTFKVAGLRMAFVCDATGASLVLGPIIDNWDICNNYLEIPVEDVPYFMDQLTQEIRDGVARHAERQKQAKGKETRSP